jgi:hypothetical protein
MNDYRKTIESNLVLKKMYELASLRFGKDRVIIRHVVPREIVAGQAVRVGFVRSSVGRRAGRDRHGRCEFIPQDADRRRGQRRAG